MNEDALNEDINKYEDGPLAAIRRIVEDLEDRTSSHVAWKKERMALTPDVDTQFLYGDIMQSNSYMYQRIEANWNDPE